MDHLQDTMDDLRRVISRSVDGEKISDSLIILLDVRRESKLQHEIRNINDELNMVINVARQQEQMITRFIDIAEKILTTQSKAKAEQESENGQASEEKPSWAKLHAFQKRAADLKSDISIRMKELDGLKQSAESTAQNVCIAHLLRLELKKSIN